MPKITTSVVFVVPVTKKLFHMFVTPQQMAALKLDSDFLANVRNAGVRGPTTSCLLVLLA
jgi:hypothetical protein